MHVWGDEGIDWKGIGDAADYIGGYCQRWGRLSAYSKEKYGTVRVYVNFGMWSLFNLVKPGYVYYTWPKWLVHLDLYYLGPFISTVFGPLIFRWQRYIYNRAYQNAIKRWPHLIPEILDCADYPEYIKDYDKLLGEQDEENNLL